MTTGTSEIYTLSHTTLFRSVEPVGQQPQRDEHDPQADDLRGHGADHRPGGRVDRKSTRLNSSHTVISYAVFFLKKKKKCYNVNLHKLTINIGHGSFRHCIHV